MTIRVWRGWWSKITFMNLQKQPYLVYYWWIEPPSPNWSPCTMDRHFIQAWKWKQTSTTTSMTCTIQNTMPTIEWYDTCSINSSTHSNLQRWRTTPLWLEKHRGAIKDETLNKKKLKISRDWLWYASHPKMVIGPDYQSFRAPFSPLSGLICLVRNSG